MSLGAFIGGLGQGVESGVSTASAYSYRNSIIKMRQLQEKQMQAAAQDDQAKRYTAFTGAVEGDNPTPLDANTAALVRHQGGSATMMPGAGLPPGMNYQPGAIVWAKQNLPQPQYQKFVQNLNTEGFSPAQMQQMNTPTASGLGAPVSGAIAADTAQDEQIANYGATPPMQAKGGVVPVPNYRTKYASGGPIDPDVSAAVAQSNGQPSGAPAQGAIPMPTSLGGPPAATTMPALPQQATSSAPSAGVAVPTPPQAGAGAPPVVPPGGMQQIHPTGLTPLVDPKAPLNVPPQVMQASTPAEAAMKHGQAAFGLHPSQNPLAQPAQSAANYTELQHGAGAESNADVQAARAKLNGSAVSSIPLGLQNASLINNLYNYDLENHGPAVAAADSYAVLQNYRINMIMYGGAAEASFANGNLPAAAHYLEQAYAFFPDGNDVHVSPGPNGSLVATRVDPNGRVLDTSSFATPKDLSAFVVGTTSFEGYNAALDAAQTAALKNAQIGDIANEEQNRNAGTGLRAQEVNQEGFYQQGQLGVAQQHLALDQQQAGKPKPLAAPSAEAVSTANSDIMVLVQPNQNGSYPPLATHFGIDKLPADAQNTVASVATDLSAYNGLPAPQALATSIAVLRDPSKFYNGNTLKIQGQTLRFGPTTGMVLNQYAAQTP